MHDRRGRAIDMGDHLMVKAWDSNLQKEKMTVGRVGALMPGAMTCNVTVFHLVPGFQPVQQATCTAHETEIVLKADGSLPGDDQRAPT